VRFFSLAIWRLRQRLTLAAIALLLLGVCAPATLAAPAQDPVIPVGTAAPGNTFAPSTANSTCLFIYTDDFSSPTSGWPVIDITSSFYEYPNDAYRILIKQPYFEGRAWPGFEASNYAVAATVQQVNDIYSSYGIVFGGDADMNQHYTFEITRDGEWEIWRYQQGSGSPWVLVTSGTSPHLLQGDSANRLKVEHNGAEIRVYANGYLLATATDANDAGLHKLGLIVSSFASPDPDVRFDDFMVYQLPCGGTGAGQIGPARPTPDDPMAGMGGIRAEPASKKRTHGDDTTPGGQ
jgi:hypothetical protein